MRKFQAFGCVKRHQIHGVFQFFRIFLPILLLGNPAGNLFLLKNLFQGLRLALETVKYRDFLIGNTLCMHPFDFIRQIEGFLKGIVVIPDRDFLSLLSRSLKSHSGLLKTGRRFQNRSGRTIIDG